VVVGVVVVVVVVMVVVTVVVVVVVVVAWSQTCRGGDTFECCTTAWYMALGRGVAGGGVGGRHVMMTSHGATATLPR
jgi:hypothetical protein